MNRLRRLMSQLGATLLMLGMGPGAAMAVPFYGVNPYTAGHGDLGVAVEGGQMHLHAHLHAGATVDGVVLGAEAEYDPDDITIIASRVVNANATTGGFLGIGSGTPYYQLPIIDLLTTPFLGWGLDGGTGDWPGGVTFELLGLNGPAGGQIAVWTVDANLDTVLQWKSVDGLGDSFLLNAAHAHSAWGFTEAGVYEVTMRATGNHATLGTLSDTATFTFNAGPVEIVPTVVPEPSSIALVAIGGVGFGAFARRRRRQARI